MGLYGEHVLPRIVNAVCGLKAVEPPDTGWKLAEKRLRATGVPVKRSGLDGQSLQFADNSFDSALSIRDRAARGPARPSTWRDPALRRARTGSDESVRRWQHRLEPIQKRVFGGCHLTRPIVDLVTNAGFTIAELDVFNEEGTPKFLGADSLRSARATE